MRRQGTLLRLLMGYFDMSEEAVAGDMQTNTEDKLTIVCKETYSAMSQ